MDLELNVKLTIKEYYPLGYVTRENTVTNLVTPLSEEKKEFFENGRDNFWAEAKKLSDFKYLSAIVSVKDYFYENGTAYSVMEYVEGQTLNVYLSKMDGKVFTDSMFELARPIINTLSQLHFAGIIHYNINPDNIMITSEGKAKLINFGTSSDFLDRDNKSLTDILKPGYAPVEQYNPGGIQGPWTDVYSLCATIYYAITGIVPKVASERLQGDMIERPSRMGIDILPVQELVLMKGMSVQQESRIQSMNELIGALEKAKKFVKADSTPRFENAKQAKEYVAQNSDQQYETNPKLKNTSIRKIGNRQIIIMFMVFVVAFIVMVVLR